MALKLGVLSTQLVISAFPWNLLFHPSPALTLTPTTCISARFPVRVGTLSHPRLVFLSCLNALSPVPGRGGQSRLEDTVLQRDRTTSQVGDLSPGLRLQSRLGYFGRERGGGNISS